MRESAPVRLIARSIGRAGGILLLATMLAMSTAACAMAGTPPPTPTASAAVEDVQPACAPQPAGAQSGARAPAGTEEPGVDRETYYSLLPALLLLLLMICGHAGFFAYMSRREPVDERTMLARDRRQLQEDDRRSRRVDAFLDKSLKRWGVHLFFGSTYVVLGLYLFAPLLDDHGSLDHMQLVAAAIAPLLTVASIYFVVRQLRKNEEATWSTTVEHVHARMHDIHRIFLEDPGLRPYFYENAPVPAAGATGQAGDRRAKILVMAELICDYFEQVIWHHHHLPTSEAKEGWNLFMEQLFQSSPALRSHLWAQRRMYPGDLKRIARVGEGGVIEIIVREHDAAWLPKGHAVLDAYFGERDEMETLDQLRQRLRGNEVREADGCRIVYEMMLVVDGEEILAAGDYCVIVPADGGTRRERPGIGFLSHLWTAPGSRRTGMTRRFDERLRELAQEAGQAKNGCFVFVAEADPMVPGDRERLERLAYFRKAGYLPVDPGKAGYLQPDFDPVEEGDASHPVPLLLLLRDSPAGERTRIAGAELRHIVESLYAMYERSIPARHMRHVRAALQGYPAPSDMVALSWAGVLPPAEGEETPSG